MMETDKLITLAASILGGLWIIIQILGHVQEKGTRNVLTAFVLLSIGLVPVAFMIRDQQAHRTATASAASVPVGTPRGPASPAPSPSVPMASPTAVASSPAASPTAVASAPADPVLTAFSVAVDRNLVGGIARVLLQCSFSPAQEATVTGYSITIHTRGRNDTAPRDHAFDRVLPAALQLVAGTPLKHDIAVDSEIGDLLIAYRKATAEGWVRMRWTGRTADGRDFHVECSNNT